MRTLTKLLIAILFITTVCISCKKRAVTPKYKTENIIVVIVDGARYSETWGDSSHKYIPHLSGQLSKTGVINTQFYNNGPTYTLAGHTSITTGFYQEINNSGNEIPRYPSFFQYFNTRYLFNKTISCIISSKDKLEILKNCQEVEFNNKFLPFSNCGINGSGSGYREDSVTLNVLFQVLSEYHPKLTLVSFKEPDFSAHSNNWKKYIKGIQYTDEYVYQIWKYIQSDNNYNGKTSLFVTNDHGRHLDSIADGFASHGDACLGCRHINLFAYGPDFKQGVVLDNKREIIDICATISELLQLEMKYDKGKIMNELFK